MQKKHEELVQEFEDRVVDLNNKTTKMSKNENEKANGILFHKFLTLMNNIKKDKD